MIEWMIKYWVEMLIVALTGAVIRLYKQYRASQMGVQALLRNAIISAYNKNMDRGYMPIYERENAEEMCRQYFALGGNGVIHDLKKDLENLPTKKWEEKA